MSELNIYQRINKVMQAVTYIKKDAKISGGGASYSAVTHDNVISVLRPHLVEHGIVTYPEQLQHSMPILRDVTKDIKMHLYDGDYAIHFVNMDNPEDRLTVTINAQATDNGDKAPGKALSYATKSAMLKTFNLETGENDESREEQKDTNYITSDQVQELWPFLVDDKGYFTELGSKCSIAFGFQNVAQIKASKYEKVLKQCKS